MSDTMVKNLVEILDHFAEDSEKRMIIIGGIYPTIFSPAADSVDLIHLVPREGLMHQAARRAAAGDRNQNYRLYEDKERVIVVAPRHM